MASIPHPLHQQLAPLLAPAPVGLTTRTRTRLGGLLWAVLRSGTVVQRQVARPRTHLSPTAAHAPGPNDDGGAGLLIRA